MPFDPAWLQLPDRTPLHALGVDVSYGTGGIDGATDLGDGFWARSSSHDGPPEDAPVRAVFWASSPEALRCVLDAQDPPVAGAKPPAVLGIADATFGGLRALDGPAVKALYRFTDGATHVFTLRRHNRTYSFRPDPADDDWPIAIAMGLPLPS